MSINSTFYFDASKQVPAKYVGFDVSCFNSRSMAPVVPSVVEKQGLKRKAKPRLKRKSQKIIYFNTIIWLGL